MRNAFGSHTCHLLVINSKPKKGLVPDSGLPAPDPWIRFLPRKSSKVFYTRFSELTIKIRIYDLMML
jgi:hypothetical protein